MRVSAILLSCNQAPYIAEAISAAFAQTFRPLEIIISDDASTDETWPIIERMAASAPPDVTVRTNRNSLRLGIAGNFHAAVNLSSGDVLVAMAGDDISRPDRIAVLADLLQPGVFAAGSQLRVIDSAGNSIHERTDLPWPRAASEAINTALRGAAAAYRREVFTAFPKMLADVMNEDYVLPLRAAMLGIIAHSDEPLVSYRTHPQSFTIGAGDRRFAISMNAVRQCQLSDVRYAMATGVISTEEGGQLHRALMPMARMAAFESAVACKHPRALPLAMAARKAGLSWRDLARSAMRFGAPLLWRAYRRA